MINKEGIKQPIIYYTISAFLVSLYVLQFYV